MTQKRKTQKTPRKDSTARKRKPRETALTRTSKQRRFNEETRPSPSLSGGAPATSVTVKDEAEALFYFARIDECLAEAWKRDVVMHEGPITIHRVIGTFFDSTHYAYVDRRLIWYLRHDPSDPLGARWEGYLKAVGDAPRGTLVRFVGRDILVKKCPPQLADGDA